MVSKGKSSSKSSSKQVLSNRENNSRLNHLYQLCNFLTISPSHTHASALARGYDRNFDLIAKKTVSKISPEVKRTICKKCHSLLIPGMTMSMYIENLAKKKDEKEDVFVNKCLTCGKCKRFPIGKNREYIPFHEKACL